MIPGNQSSLDGKSHTKTESPWQWRILGALCVGHNCVSEHPAEYVRAVLSLGRTRSRTERGRRPRSSSAGEIPVVV